MFEKLLGLASTISPSHNTEPDDVIKTKTALAQTGHYEVPSFGITPYPDTPMIDGMRNFQKDNGLNVDGVMRPGGPTETALGKQTTSITTHDPYAATPEKPKQPKPRPQKIDPLTGLPEIKMPKVPKPTANPWFKSPKVKPLPDEDHSSNTRTLNGMLQYSKNGLLPDLYASTMRGGDDKAINEFANLLQQLNERKPERVEGLEREVMTKLPPAVQAKIQNMGVDEIEADETENVQNISYRKGDTNNEDQEVLEAKGKELQVSQSRADRTLFSGSATFEDVQENISCEVVNQAMHLDSLEYFVDFWALDEDGNIIEMMTDGSSTSQRGDISLGPMMTNTETFYPPMESDYGYKVDVRIPPQDTKTGNGPGLYINIFVD